MVSQFFLEYGLTDLRGKLACRIQGDVGVPQP